MFSTDRLLSAQVLRSSFPRYLMFYDPMDVQRTIDIPVPQTLACLTHEEPVSEGGFILFPWSWISTFPKSTTFAFTLVTSAAGTKLIYQIYFIPCFPKQLTHSFSLGWFFVLHLLFLFPVSKPYHSIFRVSKGV